MLAGGILVIYGLAVVVFIGLIIFSPSVRETPAYKYETNCMASELAELAGRRVLLLVFEYDETLILDDDPTESFDPLDEFSAEAVSAYHKAATLAEWGAVFDLVDLSENSALLRGRTPGLQAAATNRQLMLENGVQGALLVVNGYGSRQTVGLSEMILQKVLPDEFLKAVTLSTDSPAIESYELASHMVLLNQQGEVVWRFYGVAATNPESVPGSALDQFAREFRRWQISIPSQGEIERFLAAGINSYLDYTAWLLRADLNGDPDKSYFAAYLAGNQPRHTRIYPAMDAEHRAPIHVRLDPAAEPPGQPWLSRIWDNAQAGDWRRPGQWAQAGAAGVLCLFSLLAFGIVVGLTALLYAFVSDSDQAYDFTNYMFGTLITGTALAGLVALYYLLKALF